MEVNNEIAPIEYKFRGCTESNQKKKEVKMMRKLYLACSFVLILLSCKELTPIDDLIEIKQAFPNPAIVGDTLTILMININIPLHVENINQVKVLLEENNKTRSFQATGYYDHLKKQEFGNFSHSKLIDSLIMDYQPVVQCLVDSSYPGQSKIGVQLNEKILKSNIILNIIK